MSRTSHDSTMCHGIVCGKLRQADTWTAQSMPEQPAGEARTAAMVADAGGEDAEFATFVEPAGDAQQLLTRFSERSVLWRGRPQSKVAICVEFACVCGFSNWEWTPFLTPQRPKVKSCRALSTKQQLMNRLAACRPDRTEPDRGVPAGERPGARQPAAACQGDEAARKPAGALQPPAVLLLWLHLARL